ncbi:MAG: hypothetical protein IPL78_31220 [Chloroflexi bacterium]|nr:hypothetical protein [Chloroflexota bacterium]
MTKLITTIENHTYEVDVVKVDTHSGEWQVRVDGELLRVRLPNAAAAFSDIEWLIVQDHPYEIAFDRDIHWLKAYRGIHRVEIEDQAVVVTRPRVAMVVSKPLFLAASPGSWLTRGRR